MNMKRVTNFLILGLFIVLSAMTVSAQVTIDAPSSDSFQTSDITVDATFNNANAIYATYYTSTDSVTWTLVYNQTNASANLELWNATLAQSTNFSTDANYSIRVNITMNNDTVDATATVTLIKVDATSPVGNVQFTDSELNNLTKDLKMDYGSEVLVNCTPTDSAANIDITQSYITIKYPGVTTYSDNLTLTANTTAQVTATILDSQTRGDLGEFSIKCFVQDNAGNTLETILNFSTQTVVVGAGSAAGSTGTAAIEGWENPVGTIKIGSGTVSDGGRLTTEGESRLMKDNAVIKFDISGEGHRIEVKTATSDKVVLTISSEPFDVTINAGETEEVDVNADGIADLEVTYHKLFANAYADLTFKQISVPVEAEAMDDESVDETTSAEEDTEDYASSNGGLTVTLAVIVIILIIGYALIKGKKK
ncbi:hypothetical protein HOK09_01300 [Candidatus Woesearchaeota archaeon]|nr:hypothetical protein [Candidatus Woesearchaeota archaeon]